MATVIIPDLDDATLEQARANAVAQGGTLEAELRSIIEERGRTEADDRRRTDEALAEMKAYREQLFRKYGSFPDSTEAIRREREEW